MDVWARRLLLVEDEPLLATLMGQVLTDAGFNVAVCHTEEEGRETARLFDPDAALIDVHLGSTPAGLYLSHALSRSHPHLGILLLSRYEDLSAAGLSHWDIPKAWRFMRKTDLANRDMLINAIESMLRGVPDLHTTPQEQTTLGTLTSTQLAVLRLAAIGLTNTAIAKRRGTTERNIEQRLKSVYDALGIPVDGDQNPRVVAVRHYISAAGLPDDRPPLESAFHTPEPADV
jgi:DNA-binding NarL/FixJ family response regulator